MAQLEEVLGRLLVPDTAVIQQATQELKQLVKDPAIVPALCTVLGSSPNPQVRQYAAVLLRKKISKQKSWLALSAEICQNIRENILQVLVKEEEKTVRKAVAQLVGTIAKHDLPEGKWPALFEFIQQCAQSENVQHREVGMFVLSVVSSSATEQLQSVLGDLLCLCAAALDDKQSTLIHFYTVQTLGNLVSIVDSKSMKAFQLIIPKVIAVIMNLTICSEEQACEAMELFDELVECEVAILVPHLKASVEFALQMASNTNLEDKTRVRALTFVRNLLQTKRKAFLKLKLIQPVLNSLFPIICEVPTDEDEQEEFDEAESQSTPSNAAQVIDVMALNLPPDKLVPPLMKLIEAGLGSENEQHRKAAYISMAVCTEGCADHIRNKYLQLLLQCVVKGVSDPSPVVRNSALFALGQFSEFLQPDISKFASELLPLMFTYLGQVSEHEKTDPRGVTRAYYAMEMFSENLGKDLVPYLPTLMQHLLNAMSSPQSSKHVKELAISAVGAATNAAKEEMVPYFQQVIEQLKVFLAQSQTEDQLQLQIQAIDTLGVLARTVGKDNFMPLAGDCLQMGLKLLSEAVDPDLRRCCYGLFAAISTLLKAEMNPYLQTIVRQMIDAIKSREGITAHYAEDSAVAADVFDDTEADVEVDLEINDDNEDEDIQGFSIENAYMDEKEDACSALGELASNTGSVFKPYLTEAYQEVMFMTDHPSANIRKSAAAAVGQFCVMLYEDAKSTQDGASQEAASKMVVEVVGLLVKMASSDAERDVVTDVLECLNEVLSKTEGLALQVDGTLNGILTTVQNIILHKSACQDDTEVDADDDQQAEYDSILMENAGDVIPTIAKVTGGEKFAPYFAALLPQLLKKLKRNCAVSEKSFAIGTIAETLDAMGSVTASFVQPLMPIITDLLKEEDEEVRSNAAYALGVLAANGGPVAQNQFPEIMNQLVGVLSKETDGRVIDNIGAALCRMIMTDRTKLPLQQTLQIIVQCLPLKEDFEEYNTVFKCFIHLYEQQVQEVQTFLPIVVQHIGHVLGTDKVKVKEDLTNTLVAFVRDISVNHPQVLESCLTSASKENVNKLKACLN